MGTVRRRRVWLAVLLAILVSGLGHAYLRRWGRAFAWYLGITATLVFIVPDAAIDQLLGGAGRPSLVDVVPALVVVAASVVDAYVLAVRNNREYDRQQREAGGAAPTVGADHVDPDVVDERSPGERSSRAGGDRRTTVGDAGDDDDAADDPPEATCPHCGRETDAELDFCHWCTEPLTDSSE